MKKTLLFRLIALVAIILPISALSQIINTFPHTEDLESWSTCSTGCSSGCILSNGWTNAASNPWTTDVGGTSSSNTGPSVDHTTGTSSGKYLYTETSGCTGTERHLVSPQIDLVGSNDMQFTFWWHSFGAAMGNTHIDVSNDDGLTWSLDVVLDLTDDQDLWQQEIVSLSTWIGDTVRVRLRYEGNTSFTGDFAVDDFLIYDLLSVDAGISAFINPVIPTCVFNDSVSVQLTNYGTDTLTSSGINWSHNGAVQPPVAWTGSLAPGAAMTVFLGTVTFANGSDLVAYTSLPNGINEFGSGAGNDTTSIIGLSTGLSGLYTVGGATPDYVDLTTAVADLNTFGTCASVIFDIRDGIYTEQITLIDLPSLNATNTVTFRSANADASLVTITQAGTGTANNYVVKMDGADFYRFENLTLENTGTTYARIADFSGGCDNNIFEGCHFKSTNSSTTSTNAVLIYSNTDLDNGNAFMNNIIEGGSFGMYWYGGSSTSGETGTVIEGNHFLSNYYYGMRLYYQDGIIVKDNKIDGPSTYTGTRYALYCSYLNQSPEITGNKIAGTATSGWRYGLYWFNGGGTPIASGKVENNMITVGYAGNTSTSYGIYMSNIGYMDLYHNSVLVSAGGTNSRALYTATGGGHKVKNNIFANYSGGYAFYMTNVFAVSESDYNVLYCPAGNTGYLSGAQATLADWQNATGFDGNSININPSFYSSTNLHVCNDSIGDQGTPIATVTTDFDGHIRDLVNPDIGADEFVGLSGSFLGPDAVVCTGDSIMLAVGAPADTILWSTGDTTSFIWVSSPGTYTVTINSVCGSGSDAIVVNQSALVYTNYVTASDLEFCNGDSVLLTGTQMADTYQWSGGSSSTNDSTYATTGGAYTLAITDACGSGSETITLTMNDVPVPSFTSTLSYLTATFTNTSNSGPNPTYLWDFGDGSTSTIANPGHIYTVSGPYNVTLTITNDCGSTTFSDSILLTIAGIDELLVNGDVNVYPNPSNGEFTIDMELISNSNVSFRVENLVGALVYETESITVDGAHSETISLGNVPTGVYFVNIQVGDNNLVKKLIIE